MTPDIKRTTRANLYAHDNVADMLNGLMATFDLTKKINPLTQAMIAEQLLKGVEIINPDLKDGST